MFASHPVLPSDGLLESRLIESGSLLRVPPTCGDGHGQAKLARSGHGTLTQTRAIKGLSGRHGRQLCAPLSQCSSMSTRHATVYRCPQLGKSMKAAANIKRCAGMTAAGIVLVWPFLLHSDKTFSILLCGFILPCKFT